ncbi:MAG TPA: ATP-dependent DNA ligase [Verrucomicrobiae bacterium]|jgi:DNA ligase-1|nr:ATP-dependent DNA ligase [Verrucomicrobiae bacterium]
MKRFTQLFSELDQTTRTNEKVAALERYFAEAPAADAAWALQFLTGRSLARVVSTKHLWQWAADASGLPPWLMAECFDTVGDLGETLALLLPEEGAGSPLTLAQLVEQRLLPLPTLTDHSQREMLLRTWGELSRPERLVWNKLITGNFRVGAARTLVVRALANVAKVEPAVMAHRVMGRWRPTAADFAQLLSGDAGSIARPYPFFLASPLEIKIKPGEALDSLGDIRDWQFEWKWDGIRAQLIRREGETLIWSRGDEMVTDAFPELAEAGNHLPDGTALDGEILAWQGDGPLPFAKLQRRLGRKMVSAKTRRDFPVAFLAYDLLEAGGEDLRVRPLVERRARLEQIISAIVAAPRKSARQPLAEALLPGFELPETEPFPSLPLRLSPALKASSWTELSQLQQGARARNVEGLMLKRRSSPYGAGRQRGDWWKWKIDPFVIDAVLVSAQRGHGRRASLYTDYTFALWDQGRLVPVAKAYSGLTDAEILEMDAFVRHNTVEKFGHVRSVKPMHVFELAFEGIQKSSRHQSGLAVRFPRMHRWRRDKKPEEADTLDALRALAG